MMSFWSGTVLNNFLFNGFNVSNIGGFTGVFVGIISLTVLCEGIRTLRDFLLQRYKNSSRSLNQSNTNSDGSQGRKLLRRYEDEDLREMNYEGPSSSTTAAQREFNGNNSRQTNLVEEVEDEDDLTSNSRIQRLVNSPALDASNIPKKKVIYDLALSSIFHIIYTFIGYTLMLAAMSFNVWIFIAIVIGFGIGFFCFGTLRRTELLEFDQNVTINCVFERKSSESTQENGQKLLNQSDSSNNSSPELSSKRNEGNNAGRTLDKDESNRVIVGAQIHALESFP